MPDNAPDPALLQAVFGMEPKDAVSYLKDKGLAITWNWAEMLDEAHARAFTVAKAVRLDVLRDIRSGLLDAVKNGKTLKQFRSELEPLLKEKGWWGKQIIVDEHGIAQVAQLGSPRRLKTIYQTNLQSAYMAGHMKAQMDAPSFVYLRYSALMDGRTRPAHRALHGRVYRKDDPIWSSLYPPNGYNCRCQVRAMTEKQAQREGVNVQDSSTHTVTQRTIAGEDKLSGISFPTTQTGVRVILPDGKPGVMWTDPGFNSSPLASHVFDDLLTKKALSTVDKGEDAFDLVRSVVLSETRMKAWNSFLENAARYGKIQNKTMTVGILPFSVAKETGFNPVLHIEDRLFIGPKAKRHAASGDGLSLDDWRELPKNIVESEFYIPTETGVSVYGNNLLCLSDEKDGRVIKIAINNNGFIDSVFLVKKETITGAVKGGLFRKYE